MPRPSFVQRRLEQGIIDTIPGHRHDLAVRLERVDDTYAPA